MGISSTLISLDLFLLYIIRIYSLHNVPILPKVLLHHNSNIQKTDKIKHAI